MTTRVYYRLVFDGHFGRESSDTIRVMQNAIENDIVFKCYYQDGTEYAFVTGDTGGGAFIDTATGIDYPIAGTVTPTVGTNTLTWVRHVDDVAIPSVFEISFEITSTAPKDDYSFTTTYTVLPTPSGGGGIVPIAPITIRNIKDWATDPLAHATSFTYDGTYTWRVNSAVLQWPDGSAGAYTATAFSVNVNALGFTDAYTATHTTSGLTATQTAVTRNTAGNVTVKPTIVVA